MAVTLVATVFLIQALPPARDAEEIVLPDATPGGLRRPG
jgi:hypothetical protein